MANNTDKRKRRFLKGALCVSIVAIIVCAIGLVLQMHTSRQGREYYSALSAALGPSQPSQSAEAEEGAQPPISVDFEDMQARFPGLVAWIYAEDTPLDYPVMQGEDNDYYLTHLPDGQKNQLGSIFMDFRNQPDFTDQNTLIYGHYVKSGDMFGSLENYRDPLYYEAHQSVWILTPEANHEVELFAAYIVNSAEEAPPMDFQDEAAFESYIADITSRSLFTSELAVTAADRLVCLCTCDYSVSNGRLILVGRLAE